MGGRNIFSAAGSKAGFLIPFAGAVTRLALRRHRLVGQRDIMTRCGPIRSSWLLRELVDLKALETVVLQLMGQVCGGYIVLGCGGKPSIASLS